MAMTCRAWLGHLSLGWGVEGVRGGSERKYIIIYADQVMSANNMQHEERDRQTETETDRQTDRQRSNDEN